MNIVAIAWSGLSIVSSLLTYLTTKTIQRNNEYIVVSFEARNESEDINYQNVRCNNSKIIIQLAGLLSAHVPSISIIKPELIGRGLKMKFIIKTNSYMLSERGTVYRNNIGNAYKIVNEYKTKMNNPQKLVPLINTINTEWGLTSQGTTISNITVDFISATRRDNSTINIQLTDQMINSHEADNLSPTSLDTVHETNISSDDLINTDNTGMHANIISESDALPLNATQTRSNMEGNNEINQRINVNEFQTPQ